MVEHLDPASRPTEHARPVYQADLGLDEAALAPDPITQFDAWFADVVAAGLPEPSAMVLATAGADGTPSARTVLLKHYDDRGFVFYTNYTSRKGQELAENPRAGLVLPWHPIRRQVTVVGEVERLPRTESEAYFGSRARGSQLGAWASERQSAVIASRAVLEERFAELSRSWPDGTEVPLPDFWGGFRVVPWTVEFWQGRTNRLHDRLRYRRTDDSGGWAVERLSP
ncbi:MAG: pyridoxamine 5'-phosphate oxidase [Streptosporangiales bacterium]|nr:pyridoxamine 5'-phosphate oxidase [Streptosporangiales bacterium]